MSYNFKSLGEVELLNTMPETANVFVEVDGGIRRAPQVQPVDEIAQIVGSETLEEVPEGATVLAEVNGEIKRVPSDGLGGGKALIIKSSDFDNAIAGVAVVEGVAAPADTYTANMTFDEVMTAFASGELIGGFLFDAIESMPYRYPIITMLYDTTNYVIPCLVMMAAELTSQTMIQLYWTADGGISTTEPESAAGPT